MAIIRRLAQVIFIKLAINARGPIEWPWRDNVIKYSIVVLSGNISVSRDRIIALSSRD